MKRAASLLALVFISGSVATQKSQLLDCYTGQEGAIKTESGYNFCSMSVDFVDRETQYSGVEGLNHPFNNSEINMEKGPCFIHYTKDNIYTYCYCQTNLCNVPQNSSNYDRKMARLNLEMLGGDGLDY